MEVMRNKKTVGLRELNAFSTLCKLMDNTDFMVLPYRGVLSKAARKIGVKEMSMYNLVKVRRNIRAMTAVAEEIKKVNREIEKAVEGLS